MGQGYEYNDMENNTVTVEICCFTNFLNMKWQNKTKSSGDKTGLAKHAVRSFFFLLCNILVCFPAKINICEISFEILRTILISKEQLQTNAKEM
jgi:hypothetical protein